MSRVCMLTTVDNPYSPVTQFNRWLLFDAEKGYNSVGLLARIAKTSKEFSDAEYDQAIESAIDEIIRNDFTNMRRKIVYIED